MLSIQNDATSKNAARLSVSKESSMVNDNLSDVGLSVNFDNILLGISK